MMAKGKYLPLIGLQDDQGQDVSDWVLICPEPHNIVAKKTVETHTYIYGIYATLFSIRWVLKMREARLWSKAKN